MKNLGPGSIVPAQVYEFSILTFTSHDIQTVKYKDLQL